MCLLQSHRISKLKRMKKGTRYVFLFYLHLQDLSLFSPKYTLKSCLNLIYNKTKCEYHLATY